MANILVLEDDQSLGYVLSSYLELLDHRITWVKTGEEALNKIEEDVFDLAIFDIMLPGIDGFETAQKCSKISPQLPFIFLSAKSLKVDKLKAYKLGAADYITKPIDEEILAAKINVLTRKKSIPSHEIVNIGKYTFNYVHQELTYKEEKIQLTTRESEMIKMFSEHINELVERKLMLAQIWGSTDEFSRKSMDVFISKLRSYFRYDPSIEIRNIHGKGFIFRVGD